MRVLITGITGPVGSFLADYLLTLPTVEVHAFKRWRSDPRPIEQLLGRVVFHDLARGFDDSVHVADNSVHLA